MFRADPDATFLPCGLSTQAGRASPSLVLYLRCSVTPALVERLAGYLRIEERELEVGG